MYPSLAMSMGASCLSHRSGGSEPAYDPATAAYLAAMPTQPPDTMKLAIDALIRSLKTNNIWDKLDSLYLVAHTDEASLVDAKLPSSTAINNSGVTFTDKKGWTGGTNKWIDLNVNLANTGNYTGGMGTMFTFLTDPVTVTTGAQCLIGSAVAASNEANYMARAATPNGEIRTYCYDDALPTAVFIGASTALSGYVAMSRNANTTIEQYVNEVRYTQISSNYNTDNVLDGNVYGCARNTNNGETPSIVQTAGIIGCFGIGGYLTGGSAGTISGEHAILKLALETYFGAIA